MAESTHYSSIIGPEFRSNSQVRWLTTARNPSSRATEVSDLPWRLRALVTQPQVRSLKGSESGVW